jgi:hypothetical protein
MKKFLIPAFVMICFFSFSQIQLENQKVIKQKINSIEQSYGPEDFPERDKGTELKTEWEYNWWNFQAAFRSWVGILYNFPIVLSPDSNGLIPQYDTNGVLFMKPVNWYSVGQALDNRSTIWEAFGFRKLFPRDPYKLDSISFYYLYDKYNSDTLKDKLEINIYTPDKLDYYTIGTGDDEMKFCTPEFSRNPFETLDPKRKVTYYFDYDDTVSMSGLLFKRKTIGFKSLDIPYGNGPCVATFTFIPAEKNYVGDTIGIWADLDSAFIPRNRFVMLGYYPHDTMQINLYSYNHSLFVNKGQRYADSWGGVDYGARYIPGFAFNHQYYVSVGFHVGQEKTIGIKENLIQKLNIYPNPTSDKLFLECHLKHNEFVNIQLYNSTGQMIKNLMNEETSEGKNTFSFDISEIEPGLYFIKMNVGNESLVKAVVKE